MNLQEDVTSALLDAIKQEGIDALLITRDANQRFLEGYTGSECYLLASAAGRWLLADARYTEQARGECRTARIVQHRDPCPPYDEVLAEVAAEAGLRRIGFEKTQLSYAQYEAIAGQLSKKGGELIPTDGIVERFRMAKTQPELERIRKACECADLALESMLGGLREGMSELEFARELESRIADAGGDGPGFQTIVAFGARSSMPHAVPRADSKLKKGDFILIDFGALFEGYRSDATRTVVFGKADAEQKEVYAAVLAAQLKGLEAMVTGAPAKVPDAVARESVKKAGYPEFEHSLGHGVGLEIHELPVMSRRSEDILAKGMVVTCEPGVYLPGWGGVRIEDSVLIGDDGPECLTHFPKDRLLEV